MNTTVDPYELIVFGAAQPACGVRRQCRCVQNADELIKICALAIKLGLTTRQLRSTTAAYPTVGSDLGSML